MKTLTHTLAVLAFAFAFTGLASASTPVVDEEGVVHIHLEQYNGYFAAKETLAGLKPGVYEITVENKAGKLVGFQIQDAETHEGLDMFPLEPGESRTSRVTITENGFRYRCPINPTPWYEVGVSE